MSTNYPSSLDTFPSAATLASQNLSTTPHSTLHGNLGDAIAAVETFVGTSSATSYTPSWQGANVTSHSATWSGKYFKVGKIGFVSIKGAITGTWSGATSGSYIELSLPSGWTTVSGWSGNGLMGCGTAFANHAVSLGVHYPMTPIVHDNATGVRFIASQKKTVSAEDLKSYTDLACNGVDTGPFDVAMVSGDEFYATITVLLA